MGFRPDWTGPSGKGKSAGAEACYHLLPKMYVLKGSVSAKSLFYHKDLPDGACIFLDDMKVGRGLGPGSDHQEEHLCLPGRGLS